MIRLGRSQSLGARVPHSYPEKGAGHVGPQHVGFMQASAGRSHAGAHMNTVQEDKPCSNSRPLALSLLESKSSQLSPRWCGSSSVPSAASTPTAASFDLSSRSSQTAQTSPPSTATFSPGREPRPGLEVAALGEVLRKTSISSRPGRANRRGSASLDMTRYNRHQQIHSEEDLMKWSHEASRYQDLALCSDLKSTAEESDEDLRNYRQHVETNASGKKADAARSRGERTPSPITDIEDDNTNRLSQAESAPSPDVDPDARHQDPADRIARELLAQEFAVFLGSSNPPKQVLQAVRKCLDDLSLSVRSARSLGFLPPHTTANPLAESAASVSFSSSSPSGQGSRSWINQRKRPQGYRQNNDDDDDDIQDDQSEDGSGISPRSDLDHRKKSKVVQYPCPFRKRSPHNFNCREWEFCAKAPFKGMSELK